MPEPVSQVDFWFDQVTHRLSTPPAVFQFLSGSQAEGGIENRVVHGVSHNAVGLRVETLQGHEPS